MKIRFRPSQVSVNLVRATSRRVREMGAVGEDNDGGNISAIIVDLEESLGNVGPFFRVPVIDMPAFEALRILRENEDDLHSAEDRVHVADILDSMILGRQLFRTDFRATILLIDSDRHSNLQI